MFGVFVIVFDSKNLVLRFVFDIYYVSNLLKMHFQIKKMKQKNKLAYFSFII